MILYLCILPPEKIAGGVRVIYRHVEMLSRNGIESAVFNPGGHPTWFKSEAPVFTGGTLALKTDDHVVIPEAFRETDTNILKCLEAGAYNHCFYQNHYNVFLGAAGHKRMEEYGVRYPFACGQVIARFLENVFGYTSVPVVPNGIDSDIFKPASKTISVAYMPRKLPKLADMVQKIFRLKYPHYAKVPWIPIEGKSEAESAEILSRAGIFLSLSSQEGFGLPPLEAMSSGCLVAGFHGQGGLEYATQSNGLWLEGEDVIGCADALARLVDALEQDKAIVHQMRQAGVYTAAQYDLSQTETALLHYFRDVDAKQKTNQEVAA